MKKIFLSLILFTLVSACLFAQPVLTMNAHLPFAHSLANIWGYVDGSGNEYALVGDSLGLTIVDVTIPSSPVVAFTVPGPPSEWREVRTKGSIAYVTTEGGSSGLQIVDLSNLPIGVTSSFWSPVISGTQLHTIHALQVDGDYLYLYGSNINGGASLIIDVTAPNAPVYINQYIYPGGGNLRYVHDGYVRHDTMYEGHIYGGFFAVVDVTNKLSPVLLATQNTPGNFTHNTWLSDDSKTLFTTDEVTNSFLTAYDVSDLTNIKELDRVQSNPGSGVIVHNTHVLNDYCVTSWYKDGVVVVDGHRPQNLVIIGSYDTYPSGGGNGFNGDWGVYPFLPSGTVVASDIDNGLYVFTPNYFRASYLEGNVTDSVCGAALSGVLVEVLTTTAKDNSNSVGDYKTGIPATGTYSVRFSKSGYNTRTITGVSLSAANITTLNVRLYSTTSFSVAGQAVVSNAGTAIAGVTVSITNSLNTYQVISDASGNFSSCNVLAGTYDVFAGKWGYHTKCLTGQVINANISNMDFELERGYYDDFTFSNPWTVTGTSPNSWVRCVPLATMDGTHISNPGTDDDTDCSNQCYVTDNGGGTAYDHDVDFGITILTSPAFDVSNMIHPTVNYSRWFYNAMLNTDPPNDTMDIMITNGSNTGLLERILNNNSTNGNWITKSFLLENYLPLTSTMKLIIQIGDQLPSNIVEGGFDKFEITNDGYTGMNTITEQKNEMMIFPNPFSSNSELRYSFNGNISSGTIQLADVSGRIVKMVPVSSSSGKIVFDSPVAAGMYFLKLTDQEGRVVSVRKLVKE